LFRSEEPAWGGTCCLYLAMIRKSRRAQWEMAVIRVVETFVISVLFLFLDILYIISITCAYSICGSKCVGKSGIG